MKGGEGGKAGRKRRREKESLLELTKVIYRQDGIKIVTELEWVMQEYSPIAKEAKATLRNRVGRGRGKKEMERD